MHGPFGGRGMHMYGCSGHICALDQQWTLISLLAIASWAVRIKDVSEDKGTPCSLLLLSHAICR